MNDGIKSFHLLLTYLVHFNVITYILPKRYHHVRTSAPPPAYGYLLIFQTSVCGESFIQVPVYSTSCFVLFK